MSDLHVPYIRPSENGARQHVKCLQLTKDIITKSAHNKQQHLNIQIIPFDSSISSNVKFFSFGVSEYSIDELTQAMHFSTMEYYKTIAAKDKGYYYLNIDPYLMGIGGDDRYNNNYYFIL